MLRNFPFRFRYWLHKFASLTMNCCIWHFSVNTTTHSLPKTTIRPKSRGRSVSPSDSPLLFARFIISSRTVGGLIKCFLPRGESDPDSDSGPFYARCDDENERSQRTILASSFARGKWTRRTRTHLLQFRNKSEVCWMFYMGLKHVLNGPETFGWDLYFSTRM